MNNKTSLPFHKAMERLNEIVGLLEQGDQTLEDSIALYEEGGRLVSLCEQKLKEAHLKIEEIEKEQQARK